MTFLWFSNLSYDMVLPYIFTWDLIFAGYDVNMLDYTPMKQPGAINALTFSTFALITPFLSVVNWPFAILGMPLWITMGTYTIFTMIFDDDIPNPDIRRYYKKKSNSDKNSPQPPKIPYDPNRPVV